LNDGVQHQVGQCAEVVGQRFQRQFAGQVLRGDANTTYFDDRRGPEPESTIPEFAPRVALGGRVGPFLPPTPITKKAARRRVPFRSTRRRTM
jgi:hypothetical protein